uniref:Uncharacterized protein n=1 Tax=Panagrolaimus sp. PS1159 TaxID=55785 RepID=A0AC35FEZ7_9BILA
MCEPNGNKFRNVKQRVELLNSLSTKCKSVGTVPLSEMPVVPVSVDVVPVSDEMPVGTCIDVGGEETEEEEESDPSFLNDSLIKAGYKSQVQVVAAKDVLRNKKIGSISQQHAAYGQSTQACVQPPQLPTHIQPQHQIQVAQNPSREKNPAPPPPLPPQPSESLYAKPTPLGFRSSAHPAASQERQATQKAGFMDELNTVCEKIRQRFDP